jgi:hypothetical protein
MPPPGRFKDRHAGERSRQRLDPDRIVGAFQGLASMCLPPATVPGMRAARHRQDSEPTQRPSQRPMPWLVEVGGVLEGRNLMVVAGRSDGGVGTQERGTGRLGWTP